MTHANGGYVEGGDGLPAFIKYGCEYILSKEFVKRYNELAELLDKLNEGEHDGD